MGLAVPTVSRTRARRETSSSRQPLRLDLERVAGASARPVELSFQDSGRFTFPSPIAGPWEENNIVPGRWTRAGRAEKQPTVILVHGWKGEWQYEYLFPFLAWRLGQAGVNTIRLELPYHGRRKPGAPGAVRNFISDDWERMMEAVLQALAELRGLIGWLRSRGGAPVGLWGFSLGAWLSAMVASADPRAEFLLLVTPICDLIRAISELPFCAPIRNGPGIEGRGLEAFNLAHHPPMTRQVLLVEAEHDLFAPKETVEELWRAWGGPEIWRVPHGHISVLLSAPTLTKAVRWIGRGSAR